MSKSRQSFDAAREVRTKSEGSIERETAKKWAARAEAAFKLAIQYGDSVMLLRAQMYRHEALEHAALIGDHGRTVASLQKRLDTVERKAKPKITRAMKARYRCARS